jgi:DNA-binding MarR family transcriptional regulator
MARSRLVAADTAVTALILEVFRFNGRLLLAGDRLVAGLGLTSARWQVLGAIALSPTAEPVARLARNMGLHRQGVQRIVNELAEEAMVEFRANPHHRRANLVVLTARGREIYDQSIRLQTPWANKLAEGVELNDVALTTRTIQSLRERLEAQAKRGSGESQLSATDGRWEGAHARTRTGVKFRN